MVMPTFTMRQLLEAGVHFGHRTRRWNPKMAPYIFGVRNKVHIIDLQQTVPLLHQAMQAVREVAANGGRVLFVGTKRQASKAVAEAAQRCGQYYVDHRWLGGMLTNWKTISNSIRRLREVEERLASEDLGLTKKEMLHLTRERDKLDRALGGIKDMGALPDILVVIDTNKEAIAVREAQKLGIPVVAVIDSNSDPDGIAYPIPGNDDSLRAIELYCDLIAGAVLDGLEEEARMSGVDVGESETAPAEVLEGSEAEGGEATPAEGADSAVAEAAATAPASAAPGVEESAATEAAGVAAAGSPGAGDSGEDSASPAEEPAAESAKEVGGGKSEAAPAEPAEAGAAADADARQAKG